MRGVAPPFNTGAVIHVIVVAERQTQTALNQSSSMTVARRDVARPGANDASNKMNCRSVSDRAHSAKPANEHCRPSKPFSRTMVRSVLAPFFTVIAHLRGRFLGAYLTCRSICSG